MLLKKSITFISFLSITLTASISLAEPSTYHLQSHLEGVINALPDNVDRRHTQAALARQTFVQLLEDGQALERATAANSPNRDRIEAVNRAVQSYIDRLDELNREAAQGVSRMRVIEAYNGRTQYQLVRLSRETLRPALQNISFLGRSRVGVLSAAAVAATTAVMVGTNSPVHASEGEIEFEDVDLNDFETEVSQ
jgi:hypothetical protein